MVPISCTTDGANRVSVLTGATSGLGRIAATALAARGDTLVLVGRNPARGQATVAELVAQTGNRAVSFLAADLASPPEVRRLAEQVRVQHPRLDLLVNNAGALFTRRQETAQGLELTFALNHLAYFLLSSLLLDPLRRSCQERGVPARVVNVASEAHRRAELNFDDLHLTKGYSGWRAYQRSKLANILFTRTFARRFAGDGIEAACLHPGFVATRFGDDNGGLFALALGAAKRLFAERLETGGGRLAFLATTPHLETGGYYSRNQPMAPSAAAQSDAVAERLWHVSGQMLGPWLDPPGA